MAERRHSCQHFHVSFPCSRSPVLYGSRRPSPQQKGFQKKASAKIFTRSLSASHLADHLFDYISILRLEQSTAYSQISLSILFRSSIYKRHNGARRKPLVHLCAFVYLSSASNPVRIARNRAPAISSVAVGYLLIRLTGDTDMGRLLRKSTGNQQLFARVFI